MLSTVHREYFKTPVCINNGRGARMHITYKVLLAATTWLEGVHVLQRGYSSVYSQISLHAGGAAESTIYIFDRDIPAGPEGRPACCYIFTGAEKPRSQLRPCDDLLWIPGGHSPAGLLCRLMERILSIQQWCSELRLLNAGAAPLRKLVDKGYELLDIPTIVWDGGFRVLSWTERAACRYSHYNETIEKGYTPAPVMKRLKRDDYFTEVNRSEHAIVKKAIGPEDFSNIYRRISNGDAILGYCCSFCEDRVVSEGLIELFDLFCSCIEEHLMRERNSIQQSNYMYESFLIELMTDPEVHIERIRERLQYLPEIPFDAEFILIRLYVRNKESFPVRYLYYELANCFTKSKLVIYKEDIYILHSLAKIHSDRETVMERVMQSIKNIVADNDVFIGISNPFSQLNKLHYAYIQCIRAVELGSLVCPNERLFNYRDVLHCHLFECIGREIELSSIYEDRLSLLKKLGSDAGLDYLNILRVYLKNERRATSTANELNLHRNTVLYHIKKIEEFLGTEFDDYMLRLSYQLAFLMADWDAQTAQSETKFQG